MKRVRRRFDFDLGLQKVDRTATRQAVRAWFAVYRQYKLLLEMDFVPRSEVTKVVRGYENAMDPDLIRGSENSDGGMLRIGIVVSAKSDGTHIERGEDRYRKSFVKTTEYKVNRLPTYQRDIIRHQYMQEERPGHESRLPSDTETYQYLVDQKWYVSERYYDEEKAKAIMTLAEAFGIVQFEEKNVRF